MQDSYRSRSISKEGAVFLIEPARNQKGLANGIRQRVLGFVLVARSNRMAGHSLISMIRSHVRLTEPDFERLGVSCETRGILDKIQGVFEAITRKGVIETYN